MVNNVFVDEENVTGTMDELFSTKIDKEDLHQVVSKYAVDADDEKINSHAVINDIFSGIEEERRRKREASARRSDAEKVRQRKNFERIGRQ